MTVYCCFTHRIDPKYGEWPKLEAVFTDESKAKEWIKNLPGTEDFVESWGGGYWNWIWSRDANPTRQAYIEKVETQ